jgi:hypothetical protein
VAEPTTRQGRRRPVLEVSLLAVLTADLVGGLLDVAAGRASLWTAWGSSATLCAPWPMITFQVVSLLLVRRGGRVGRVAGVLLALACTVSLASGFFDGQLGRADLSAAEVAFQVVLLLLTGVLGVAAILAVLPPAVRGRGQKAKRPRSADSHAPTGSSPQAEQSRAASSACVVASDLSPTAAAASARKASTGPSGAPVPAAATRPDHPVISG